MKGKDGGKVVEEFEKEGKVVTKEEMERGRGKGKGKYIGKKNRGYREKEREQGEGREGSLVGKSHSQTN